MNEPNHEAVCLWERSSYTYRPFVAGSDPQALCQANTVQTKTWGFCAQIFGASSSTDQWGVAYSGYFTTTNLPFSDLAYTGLPVYYTTSMRGSRTYKNYVSGYSEVANIVYLQVTHITHNHTLIQYTTHTTNVPDFSTHPSRCCFISYL